MDTLRKLVSKRPSIKYHLHEGKNELDYNAAKETVSHNSMQFRIYLLDDAQPSLEYNISKNELGRRLFIYVCASIGDLIECDYFGLLFKDKHNRKHWLNLEKSVSRQMNEHETRTLYFRLKHYPIEPIQELKQELTRHLVYLQIRRDLVHGRLNCPTDLIGTIGGLIVQAEMGDEPVLENCDMTTGDVQSSDREVQPNSPSSQILLDDNVSPSKLETCEGLKTKYPRHLKIFDALTPEMEDEVMRKHREYRGWKTHEAETELLRHVSKLPTYGMIPLSVTVKQKISANHNSTYFFRHSNGYKGSHIAKNSGNLSRGKPTALSSYAPVYLGTTGLVLSSGPQQTQEYHWDVIDRLVCDGKRLSIYLKKDKAKSGHLTLDCESKAAALTLWRWILDRMYFFTLKDTRQAIKVRSNTSLLRRHNTFRFSGRSHHELLSLPMQPIKEDILRTSSVRPSDVPLDLGPVRSTHLEPRRTAMDLHQEFSEKIAKEAPLKSEFAEELIQDAVIPEDPNDQPASEKSVSHTVAEDEDQQTPESEADQPISAQFHQLHNKPEEEKEETEQQDAVSALVEEPLLTSIDIMAEKPTEPNVSAVLQQHVYEQVLSALDCAINEHTSNPNEKLDVKPPNSVNSGTVQNGCLPTHQNGPIPQKSLHRQHEHVSEKQQEQSSDLEEIRKSSAVGFTAQAAATVVVMVVLIGMIVVLESTPIAESSILRLVRNNAVASGVHAYIYDPVRKLVRSGLSLLWS